MRPPARLLASILLAVPCALPSPVSAQGARTETAAAPGPSPATPAERRLSSARVTIQALVDALTEELRDYRLPRPRVQAALERAESLVESFVETSPGDPQAQRLLLALYGDLIDAYAAHADDSAAGRDFGTGQRRSAERAVEIGRRLAASDPANVEAGRDLALALSQLGETKLSRGAEAAREPFEEGVVILRRLSAADPGDEEVRRDLSLGLGGLGEALAKAGDTKGALAAMGEGLAIMRALAADDPTDSHLSRDLMIALGKAGRVREREEPEAARAEFEEALLIARRLAVASPFGRQANLDLAAALGRIADSRAGQTDRTVRIAALREMLEARRRLVLADPTDYRAAGRVGESLGALADELVATAPLAALPQLLEALVIARRLAAIAPDDARAELRLVERLRAAAEVELSLGQTDEACKHLREGKALLARPARPAGAADPPSTESGTIERMLKRCPA